jgi:hypothetical protein
MIGYGYSYFVSTILDTESGTPPVNTVAPVISGTQVVGSSLSCTTGTWTGTPTITYAYQWYRGATLISGATSSSYTLVQADAGNTSNITCQVTATNGIGNATATSNTSAHIFDFDADAFITAAAITDPTQQSAINQLVLDLKGYSIWTKMKALYPFVGGSASSHKFNLKNPLDTDAAFRLVFNGGWTHSSTGALPNGINAYADTKFIPNSNITVSSGHFSVYNRNNDLVGTKIDGVNSGSTWVQMNHSYGDFIFGQIASYASYTPTDTRGLFLLTRTANNSFKIKRNNTNLLTNTGTVTSLPTHSIYIGARNDSGSYNHPNSYQKAFASIGDGLLDSEANNLYLCVQQFNTTLGRQV